MDSAASNESDDGTNTSSPSKQPTILIVDDHDDNLLLLRYALEDLGCSIVQASCGSDALELAAQHSFDLILLDILLPDISGMTVVSHLRHRLGMQKVPIIAVTALARATEKSDIIAAGFTAYLSKPYMIDELYTLIKRYTS